MDVVEIGVFGSDKIQNQGLMKFEEVVIVEVLMGFQGLEVFIGKCVCGKVILGCVGVFIGEVSVLFVVIDMFYQIFDNQGIYVYVVVWYVDGKFVKSVCVYVGEFQVGEIDEYGLFVFFYLFKGLGGKSVFGVNMVMVVDIQDENL